jgi:hypothetical protein
MRHNNTRLKVLLDRFTAPHRMTFEVFYDVFSVFHHADVKPMKPLSCTATREVRRVN